jgi:hypothetical protein
LDIFRNFSNRNRMKIPRSKPHKNIYWSMHFLYETDTPSVFAEKVLFSQAIIKITVEQVERIRNCDYE